MGTVVFLTSDRLGTGEPELGEALRKAFLETLGNVEPLPGAVILMNAGVHLTVESRGSTGSLKRLEEAGVDVLACGTCLDYYGLTDDMAVGRVSNMVEITTMLMNADCVITP